MTITAAQIKLICEQLRDELTAQPHMVMVYPMAFDIIASRTGLQERLAAKITEIMQ